MKLHNVVVRHPDGTETVLGPIALLDADIAVAAAIEAWETKQKARAEYRAFVDQVKSRKDHG